jgi:protein-S-isoprenylcysteine O-methyltransferase Ste14
VIPLPFLWPALVPFWIAFSWALAGELPFLRRDRATRPTSVDRGSKLAILIAGGIGVFSAFVVARAVPRFSVATGRVAVYIAGISCIAAGGWLRRHCFRMLGASFTFDVRVEEDQAIVDRGAYRFVRHPSYSAGMLLFGGIGLALTNWLSLVVAVVPPAVAYAYRISVEEHALVDALGPAYARYMKRTKRLVPFVV